MTPEFWITIAAIVAGPFFAVVVTHILQESKDLKQRRMHVFRGLMTSRRTPLSPERVQALNLIEVEFFGKQAVLNRFSDLLEVYNDQVRWKSEDSDVRTSVLQEVDDKTVLLLQEMGRVLGYKLENLTLLRGGYYPEAFSQIELQQNEIREFLVGLKKGSLYLPTALLDVRHPQKMLEEAQEAQLLLTHAERQKANNND